MTPLSGGIGTLSGNNAGDAANPTGYTFTNPSSDIGLSVDVSLEDEVPSFVVIQFTITGASEVVVNLPNGLNKVGINELFLSDYSYNNPWFKSDSYLYHLL